ncbi:hypothetical protein GobsT_09170 [Gemmata obscuriglobus]|uniref:Uncharacterized protein n=1 Tax=Gemmata obscuriglobus TaxID=114 RepID=A0A2Z3HC55_9BACT
MRSVSWLMVALVWGGLPCAAGAQPAKDRAPITAAFADWQARQKAVKTARYVLSGTTEFLKPLSPDSSPVPANDRTKPYQAVVLFDIEGGRFRFESTEYVPAENGYQKRSGTVTFDGAEMRQGHPRDVAEAIGGFDLLIGKKPRKDEPGAPISDLLLPLLFAHGVVPTVHQPAYIQRLPLTLAEDDFVVHGRHTLRGNTCVVFRTEPKLGTTGISDEYWVKPERLSPVIRAVQLAGGQPWTRTDIEWGETVSGWMPRSWSHAFTANGKDLNRLTTIKVDRYEPNPNVTDADFSIPAVPGMKEVIVGEEAPAGSRPHPGSSGRRVYRITDGGEWVEVSSQGWKSLDGTTDIPLPTRWGSWPWAAVGVVVFLGGWAVYRWRSRRAAPAPPTAS